jgi:hypothetical protein
LYGLTAAPVNRGQHLAIVKSRRAAHRVTGISEMLKQQAAQR